VSLSGTGIAPGVNLTPSSLTFAAQNVGTTSAVQTVTLSNNGTATLSITKIATSGDFAQTNNCGTTLAPNASCTINVTFTPTAIGSRTGALSVTDNASGSPQSVSLSGTGVAPLVCLSPAIINFAGHNVGTSSTLSVMLTNCGNAALVITSITATGDFSQSNNCVGTLAVNASCVINVTFTPTTTGLRTGVLSLTDNAPGSPQSVGLSGTGTTPGASLSPPSLTFGPQGVGTTSPAQTVTLTNSGTGPLTITNIAISGDFAQTNTCGNTLAAGASCPIQVTFTPTTTGTRTGTLSVTDNAAGSPQLASLTGTGSTGPTISNLSSTAGPAGISVTINGSNFGTTQGSSTVTFNGTIANVTWGPTAISTTVPLGATSGNVVVTVGGQASNGVPFIVQDDALHIFGVNCSTCGFQVSQFTIQNAPLYGYVIQAGDVLNFYQNQSVGSVGGITLCFADGDGICDDDGSTVDQDGQPIQADTFQGVSHFRKVNLTPSAGLTLSQIIFDSSDQTQPGRWDVLFSAVEIISADGTVRPIFTTGSNPSLFAFSTPGVSQLGSTIDAAHVWPGDPFPKITSLSVNAGPVGTLVTINGANFGTTQGTSTVTFNGIAAQVTWGATSITATVPVGALTGNVVVKVGNTASNGVVFTVQDDALHIFGVNCGTCGFQSTHVTIQNSPLYGYVIQPGDVLAFYQTQGLNSVGGITLCFANGDGSCDDDGSAVDQDGQPIHADTFQEVSHFRRVDLNPSAGMMLIQIDFDSSGQSGGGAWDILYSNVQIISADGTAHPIFTTGSNPGLFIFSSPGVSGQGSTIDHAHVW
jgi:hypothetical protein